MAYDQMLTARFARQTMDRKHSLLGGGAGHSHKGGRSGSILQNSYKDMMLTNSIAAVQQAFAASEKNENHSEIDSTLPPSMTGGGGGGHVIGRGEVTL